MPQRLTTNQSKIYNFIKDRLDAEGESPTLAELAQVMDVSSLRSVTQYLDALVHKGLIVRNRYAHRGVRLVEKNENDTLVPVPVFASAGCGQPSVIAEQSFGEYATVSAALLGDHRDRVYLIRAVGNSMVDAGINDGDLVLTERTDDASDNDIIVAIIDDSAVIKRITFSSNAVILQPVSSDPSYRPIIMQRNFPIFGKVIKVISQAYRDDYQLVPLTDSDA